MYAVMGALIFDGYEFHKDKTLIIDKNIIADIVDSKTIPQTIKKIDLEGLTLCAAFIDLQINGCGGVLFNDDISVKTIQTMFETVRRFGCATFVPTLITADDKDIKAAISAAADFHKQNPFVIPALHIEGPFISKKRAGTHNPNIIRAMDGEMVDFLIESSRDIPIILTIAPEENDPALIRKLALNGIKLSIGHSAASYAQAVCGISNGIKTATHLFNAMTPFEGRSPGVVGAVLNNDIYSGIIVDGIHSDFNSVAIAKKAKGAKLYIVTDAATSMGSDLKEFYFGGFKVFVKDGVCRNENGALAGSNIDMASSVKNAVRHAGIAPDEAIRMATLYPSKFLGLEMSIGSIQKGMQANLTAFDGEFRVKKTMVGGEIVFGCGS